MAEQLETEPTAAPAKPSTSKGSKLQRESRFEVYFPAPPDDNKEAIPVASFPMIVYFWPTTLAFLICGLLQWTTGVSPATLGWWAYGFLAFNLVVIVQELDQKKFAILVLAVGIVALLGYVSSLKGSGILESLSAFLGGIQPTFSTSAYFLIGLTLVALLVVGLFQPLFDYWRIEPNEFVHYIQPWGRDQSIPRQGSTISREVPDVLELLLTFGGGTLVIRREGEPVARIEHVPFLGRRMASIERMLGVTRVKHVASS